MKPLIALFGEAQKGDFARPFAIRSLIDLYDCLGEPPPDSLGIDCAVQCLQNGYLLFYIRVEEEGFSTRDYKKGLRDLRDKGHAKELTAMWLPGVGDRELFGQIARFCNPFKMVILVTERDLYDYLTCSA